MGLDVSHDAFSGAYSAFNRFRQCVARAAAADFPPHWVYDENGQIARDSEGHIRRNEELDNSKIYFPDGVNPDDGLWIFLAHSDCDGELSPEESTKVADTLEMLLPAIEALAWDDHGHIGRDGGYVAVTKKFIAGCREAVNENEPLCFA